MRPLDLHGADRPAVGTVIASPDPALTEAAAGLFDFVWIDLEHGALDLGDVQTLAIASQGSGCATYVRLPHWDTERLPAVVDSGVDGVVDPQIEIAEQAVALVRRLRYPPRGRRGFGPRRAGGYGRVGAFWRSPEAEVACAVQIETRSAVENVGEIAAVEGIEALVLGTADLSTALGCPGEVDNPEMRAAAEEVQTAARAADVAFGLAGGGDPEALVALVPERASLYVYSVDLRLYRGALSGAAQTMRRATQHASRPSAPATHVPGGDIG